MDPSGVAVAITSCRQSSDSALTRTPFRTPQLGRNGLRTGIVGATMKIKCIFAKEEVCTPPRGKLLLVLSRPWRIILRFIFSLLRFRQWATPCAELCLLAVAFRKKVESLFETNQIVCGARPAARNTKVPWFSRSVRRSKVVKSKYCGNEILHVLRK